MVMQLPAIPLNTKHNFPYITSFQLDTQQYHCCLDNEQLDRIKLVCEDSGFYTTFGFTVINQQVVGVFDPDDLVDDYAYSKRKRSRSRSQDLE